MSFMNAGLQAQLKSSTGATRLALRYCINVGKRAQYSNPGSVTVIDHKCLPYEDGMAAEDISDMEFYAECCRVFGVPGWVAPLMCAASRLKSDKARRKKTYKLIHHKLFKYKVGCDKSNRNRPTYVYPREVKELIRTVFPEDVCDHPDPSHAKVVLLTVEDLSSLPV